MDAIIYGTGFTATDYLAPLDIKGRGGLDLNAYTRENAETYYGITASHFPNLSLIGFADTPVYQRVDLPPGSSIDGSLIVEQMDTTTIVSPGQMATSDECGNLVLRFVEGPGNTLMGWLTCKRPSIIKFEVTSPK